MFKNPSPLFQNLCYTLNTELKTVRRTDAAAIAADIATVPTCDTPASKERTYENGGSIVSRRAFLFYIH